MLAPRRRVSRRAFGDQALVARAGDARAALLFAAVLLVGGCALAVLALALAYGARRLLPVMGVPLALFNKYQAEAQEAGR
mgnify:CR=1 FL=1